MGRRAGRGVACGRRHRRDRVIRLRVRTIWLLRRLLRSAYAPAYAWGAPAYYDASAYDYDTVYPSYGYSTVSYGYAPRYAYGYRRVVGPAYAYRPAVRSAYAFGGPRAYVHRQVHRHWR